MSKLDKAMAAFDMVVEIKESGVKCGFVVDAAYRWSVNLGDRPFGGYTFYSIDESAFQQLELVHQACVEGRSDS